MKFRAGKTALTACLAVTFAATTAIRTSLGDSLLSTDTFAPVVARAANGRFVVHVSAQQRHDRRGNPCGFDLDTTFRDRHSAMRLNSLIRRPLEVWILGPRRAVLYGDIDWQLKAFTVFDPVSGIDELDVPGRALARSPDGSKFAFVRLYAEHMQPLWATSNVYVVYDLRRRIVREQTTFNPDVGIRVFPHSDISRALSEVDFEGIHRIVGRIRWLSNDRFTFVDRYRRANILVDVRRSGPRWDATEARVGRTRATGSVTIRGRRLRARSTPID